jgi:hypothetical protein
MAIVHRQECVLVHRQECVKVAQNLRFSGRHGDLPVSTKFAFGAALITQGLPFY